MIKLVASDLDGTLLLHKAQSLPEEIFSLIRQLEELGIMFVAASGRQYPNMTKLFAPVASEISYISEASQAGKAEVRLYENIVDEEKGVYNKEDGSLNVNPNSLTKVTAYVEPALMEAKGYDSFQFVRTGFFCADIHDSKEGAPIFNRIVSLKSSFKLPKA